MALGFSSGLLTGLQQFGQGGGAIPADPRQRNAIQAAGVTNPLLQQFGRGLGGMLGTEMRSPAEIEKERLASAMDTAFQKTTQGTASAQQGNVAGVSTRISELQQAMSAAKTLPEKQLYAQQIQQLQRMIPDAKELEISNNAKSILQAEQALESGAIENEQARESLTKRVEELKKDPEAMRQYNKFKMDQWRTQQAEQEMGAQQWIQSNSNALTQAVQEDDFDEVDRIIGNAGEYSQAAQAYVSRVAQNVKSLRALEEASIENKIAPSVDLWEEKINALPEEIRKSFEPSLKAYKNVSKGWNEKTETWNTGARIRAKQIEQEMSGLYRNMINQLAVSDFASSRREENKKQEQIKDLELKINTPMDSNYIARARTIAASMLGKKETLTPDMVNRVARELYDQDIATYRAQLDYLTREDQEDGQGSDEVFPEGTDGGFSVKNTKGEVITKEYAKAAKEKGFSPEQLAEAANISLDQARVLMGTPVQSRQKTQEEMIQEGGLINPFRARAKLEQSQLNRG